jgi:ABC-type phosphate transport system auxiliary subunit
MPKTNELKPENQELEKLSSYFEKYIKLIKAEISEGDKKIATGGIDDKQQTELQNKKQELTTKIEKAQSYLDKIRVPENRNFVDLGQPKKY